MEATDHMKIALNYLEQANDGPQTRPEAIKHAHKFTTLAADHIDRARALDPHAVIEIKDSIANIDSLIQNALYIQGFYDARYGRLRADVQRGIDALQKSLRYGPESSEAHLQIAIGYTRLGETVLADRAVAKAIELEPANLEAHELRDGTKTYPPVEYPFLVQVALFIFTDWRMLSTLLPLVWFVYCMYSMVIAMNRNEDASFYMWWVVGMCAAYATYNWLHAWVTSYWIALRERLGF
jgi:tetratricopeptide (TPR) repeat protein